MTDLEALPLLQEIVRDPELRKWLDRQLLDARRANFRQQPEAVEFAHQGGPSFLIDGEPVTARGAGLLLGWRVLHAHQKRLQGVDPASVYSRHLRPDATALQALQRAAMHVPEPLAACLRAIGTVGGVLVVKGKLPCSVVCTSPEPAQGVTST